MDPIHPDRPTRVPTNLSRSRRIWPTIGFPITIMVLFYGPYPQVCRRFFRKLFQFTDPSLFELRVGLNEVVAETKEIVSDYVAQGLVDRVYESPTNLFKSPMMRRMVHEDPIETTWSLWFDDDSFPYQGDWLPALANRIENESTVDAWGRKLYLHASEPVEAFIRSAPWYRGKPFIHEFNGVTSERPYLFFMEGAYWALKSHILYDLDWPDPRLIQNEEDFVFGEALHQNEYRVEQSFSGVRLNAGGRRTPRQTPLIDDAPPQG